MIMRARSHPQYTTLINTSTYTRSLTHTKHSLAHKYTPAQISAHVTILPRVSLAQGPNAKKEEFQKYLEKVGVIDALTKGHPPPPP